ncbi:hypothetical protein CTI12_AA399190 [Artemisia annua]|uniref:Retrotransposon Copia-like N-terminal domain-containing protein n=1 Tax=Artemisia annua TaxID=35608 RepID=A0A2U1MCA3_ARTAN|nr:hypothetical protein CTI12_AA399190 [Artemisia annua]
MSTSNSNHSDPLSQPAVFQNPLYLHPSDGPGSLTIQEKLVGSQNYRAWHRAIEIGLSIKRKLGFVKGTVSRSLTDENMAELWDTCNNMVICWILGLVSESIARSIMFVGTASEMWQQLERRSVQFVALSGIHFKWHPPERCWEKVGYPSWHPKYKQSKSRDAQNRPPQRTVAHVETRNVSFTPQQFEQLMRTFQQLKSGTDVCDDFEHTFAAERCWEKVGYPSWHPKYKQSKSRDAQNRPPQRTVAHVETGNVSFTPQQFEQLMGTFQQLKSGTDVCDDFEHTFAAGLDNQEGDRNG